MCVVYVEVGQEVKGRYICIVHLCINIVFMCVYIIGGPGCEGKVSAIHGWEQESFVSYMYIKCLSIHMC